MTTKISQKHAIKGRREFELVGDSIEYRIETPFSSEELSVVLSVLDPEPVREGSMLHFVSVVNREALVKMFVDKPNPETFGAFVSTLQERIKDEEFGRLAAGNRNADISAEQIDTTISMLETYLDPEPISGLLAALRELKSDPDDGARLARVAEVFNNLGAQKGPVLTYAPFFMSLLASNE